MGRIVLTNPLAAFRDPARRPRAIIWTLVGVISLALAVIVALGVTSTYWFCANGCHKVQDDTIIAYDSSSHAEVSCMACHMPVGASPVTFLLHKAEALGELYLTATNTFELPLNAHSHLAMEEDVMGSGQCTQCHGPNREITPSPGIIIDHAVHEENDVHCTVCHNRVAHPEDFELTLEGNAKHEDFMEMQSCFRCHGLEQDAEAPGACDACHPSDFELKPENHLADGFYAAGGPSAGHAVMSVEREGYCRTCHEVPLFCTDCHGIEMPHPGSFAEEHGAEGKESPQICANCHASAAGEYEFCNACHHETADPTRPWIPQHFEIVQTQGAGACFECHRTTYCAGCHVRGLR